MEGGLFGFGDVTGELFYSGDPDDPAGLALEGLAPSGRYTLRLFASRAAATSVARGSPCGRGRSAQRGSPA